MRSCFCGKKLTSMDDQISIVPYRSGHRQAWFDLNEAWISKYFVMEPADYKSLRDPEGYILDKGGHILIAERDGEAIGTCGLIKMDHPRFDYELAKMCVSPQAQGLGVGYRICQASLDLARKLGARCVYLETNHQLTPAISLYRKLGFIDVAGLPSPYARCDVQLAVEL